MKYIIMFFCIIFCIIGDAALWVVGKMSELVSFGTGKVRELERGERRGAHEKCRLLICGEVNRTVEETVPCCWPDEIFAPYDWAMEEPENET